MDEKLIRSADLLVQSLGRQSAFWGLGKTAGEIYGVLYLSADPLSLEDVATGLKLTKGNISIAVRQLEQLGMVRRSWRQGDRRVFFEAETDFWKIGQSFLGLRHKPEFDQSFSMLEESIRLVDKAGESAEKAVIAGRLKSLQEFYSLLDSVVSGLLSLSPDKLKWIAGILPGIVGSEGKMK